MDRLSDPQNWIVPELAYNGHKYEQGENATKENGWLCKCGYPELNHPDECFGVENPFAAVEFADNSDYRCPHGVWYDKKCYFCDMVDRQMQAQCLIHGHVIQTADWAAPDSGYMGAWCIWCGIGGGSYLY